MIHGLRLQLSSFQVSPVSSSTSKTDVAGWAKLNKDVCTRGNAREADVGGACRVDFVLVEGFM